MHKTKSTKAAIHRTINTIIILILFVLVVFFAYESNQVHEHDIFECEKRLYEKLTNQKYPFKNRAEQEKYELGYEKKAELLSKED